MFSSCLFFRKERKRCDANKISKIIGNDHLNFKMLLNQFKSTYCFFFLNSPSTQLQEPEQIFELSPDTTKGDFLSKKPEKAIKSKLPFYRFEKALILSFLRKLPFLSGLLDSHSPKTLMVILGTKETIEITEFITKKLGEVSMYDSLLFPVTTPPRKKRKLLSSSSSEPKEIKESTESSIKKINSSPERTGTSCKSIRKHKQSPQSSTPYRTKHKNTIKDNYKILQHLRIKSNGKIHHNIPPSLNISSPLKSAQNLCLLFSGCINFVKASKFSTIKDVDLLLKKINHHGQVISIRDHWSRQDSSSRSYWIGALVVYKQLEDSQRVIKELFVNRDTSLLPVYVPQHLMLIGHFEAKMSSTHPGSSIFIEGFGPKAPRDRIRNELDQYGEVMSCNWKANMSGLVCEVTYQFTVEAVAAALALDGKCLGKNVLKTGIKMEKKEKALHMMVCGHYC